MIEPRGFVSRWSRRKRMARAVPPLDEPPAEPDVVGDIPPPAVGEAGPEGLPIGAADTAATPAELSEEELATLPPVDALTAETDISAFLRRGVPLALRHAALRRAWSVDPKIRDFVNDAREYAYDWNTPGGVPGSGPLREGFDAAGMVERLFSGSAPLEREAVSEEPVGRAAGADDEPAAPDAQPEAPDGTAPTVSASVDPQLPPGEAPSGGGPASGSAAADVAAPGHRPPIAEAVGRRRHGGAVPV